MFGRSKARLEAKIERERERFRRPATDDGARIANSDLCVWVGVLVFLVLALSIGPKRMPMVNLLILGLAVAALSEQGRRRLTPVVYNFFAAKFQWGNSYEQALENEMKARAEARAAERNGGVPPAKAAAEPVVISDRVRNAIAVFLGLTAEERKEALDRILTFLAGQGIQFPDLEDADTPEDRNSIGVMCIKRFAKQNGIEPGGPA